MSTPRIDPAVLAGIDLLLADMETFATGSYLRPEEQQWWTPPYPVACLPQLRQLLEEVCGRIGAATCDSEVREALQAFEPQLLEFNASYDDAVIEPEEQAEITALLQRAYQIRRAEFAD